MKNRTPIVIAALIVLAAAVADATAGGTPTIAVGTTLDSLAPISNQALTQAVAAVHGKIGDTQWEELKSHLRALNQDITARGILAANRHHPSLLTGYFYGQVYDWDLYFESIYAGYNGVNRFCFNNLDAFFALEHPDGFIQRAFGTKSWGASQQFKPFIAQIALLGNRQSENLQWLSEHYDQMRRFLDRWAAYDGDHNGLSYWPGGADQAGTDNQGSRCVGHSEGVDLNCYLYRDYQAMSILANRLGKADDARLWEQRAETLAAKINNLLWDEQDGLYYDRDELTGTLTKKKAVSCFTPLWAGIIDQDRAKRMVQEHLTNPKEFWTKYPVPSYAISERDFYLGTKHGECNWHGNTWIPTNYMIFHGLVRYGFRQAAEQLAYDTLSLALANPTTREYYNSETGEGYGCDPFYGWSSLAYVMPFEFELNFDPTDLSRISKMPNLLAAIGVDDFKPDDK
jgi:putative isomerase